MRRVLCKLLVVLLVVEVICIGGSGNIVHAISNKASDQFNDVTAGDWYEKTLEVMLEKNIIAGYDDGTFRGNDFMQRDQFIKTMVVALDQKTLPIGKTYWASTYIERAVELGIIEDGQFDNYTETISRGEMAMIAKNTIEAIEGVYDYQYMIDIKDQIEDIGYVRGSGYSASILKMYEQGVILGYPEGEFKPLDGLKRQEAITVIHRVIDESIRKPYEGTAMDLSQYTEQEQEWIMVTGQLPFEDYLGTIVNDDVLDDRHGGYEPSRFPIGIYFYESGEYSTEDDGNYSFRLKFSHKNVYNSEAPELHLEYLIYQTEHILKSRAHVTDHQWEQIKERILIDYDKYIQYRETDISQPLGDVHIVDDYGRYISIGGRAASTFDGFTQLDGWLKYY